ncbi:hypothetical protein HETIRDRAFT_164862 [Heterobasidion irregulare TC 32-1]|uniref:Uncharacterized protein n=1 Tax=Heterobasidion irregulare (strain TC 32-1) TaxID=747525 RepID=W4JPC3_HETIT|nr:uncharacterized protein HETIRDRAFT_164862 [Heterobasidion irregulare TC 32-1]ETW74935.1 hypothetical protein HETIRDRAFT_164862 [Heterobasidion irregulare TC 32-1]
MSVRPRVGTLWDVSIHQGCANSVGFQACMFIEKAARVLYKFCRPSESSLLSLEFKRSSAHSPSTISNTNKSEDSR